MAEHREAVVFPNRDGLKLFGILHRPVEVPEREIGVIFLSPGVKSRVGPHRLYVKMTERLVAHGYPVLCFDFFGLGDSEGELPEKELVDLYVTVQDGRYTDDSLCAIDWMEQRLGKKAFVLAGLCGGALTGLFAAERDSRVKGVLGLGLPVALDGRTQDPSRFMTQGQLDDIGRSYLAKVFNPSAWWRLITFKSDYRMLGRALVQKVRGRGKRRELEPSQASPEDSNLNPLFRSAFSEFASREGKILLVFSGADRLAWEFEEKFAEPYALRASQYADHCDVRVIPNANHILSDPLWRQEMLEHADKWLARCFGKAPS